MMHVLCMLFVIPAVFIIFTKGCVYPSYLQAVWIDKSSITLHNVSYKEKDMIDNRTDFHSRITWNCLKSLRMGKDDLVVSKTTIYDVYHFLKCELYHKEDDGHVYFKSIRDPFQVENLKNIECNVCQPKVQEDTIPSRLLQMVNETSSPTGTGNNKFWCSDPDCTLCPVERELEENSEKLRDEARSLRYLLRQWLADKREGE
ncbi:uncharacterized protein LOC132562502 [Ylistrum balloti]|uniref:uncharacterized protein LOC132562502 n=1 Tax=Ylistrum balloti TaxID=509963 RepID=UPI002905E661|nr:uncharacterized protein LOC132562502 [Ylistrum balloti]